MHVWNISKRSKKGVYVIYIVAISASCIFHHLMLLYYFCFFFATIAAFDFHWSCFKCWATVFILVLFSVPIHIFFFFFSTYCYYVVYIIVYFIFTLILFFFFLQFFICILRKPKYWQKNFVAVAVRRPHFSKIILYFLWLWLISGMGISKCWLC